MTAKIGMIEHMNRCSTLSRLVNRYEELTHSEISERAERWGLSVYPKVRVADAINLDALGVAGELKRYGLQAHFDFLVCRERWQPEYAVEFDGRFHSSEKQARRDAKKDKLCELASLPILRINSNYLSPRFGSMSLLAWIMDVYELQRGFDEHQAEGAIPPDEPFDPFFFMGVEPEEDRFPYWLSARSRVRLQRLHEKGAISDPISSGFIGYDADEVMRGIEWIRVSNDAGVYVRTAMRPQQFPLHFGDLLDEILSVQLTARVEEWLRGEASSLKLSDIDRIVREMSSSLKMSRAHSYGPSVVTD